MIEPGRFEELLKASFGKTLCDLRVDTVYAGWDETGWGESSRALVTVVSPDFEGMQEGRRQEMVWERVLADLSEDAQHQIEFIFTRAPSELGDDPRRGADRPVASSQPEHHG